MIVGFGQQHFDVHEDYNNMDIIENKDRQTKSLSGINASIMKLECSSQFLNNVQFLTMWLHVMKAGCINTILNYNLKHGMDALGQSQEAKMTKSISKAMYLIF